jgi:hypothetical protein
VVPQSELARQATQVCEDTWQSGDAAAQSVLVSHCTHDCVVALHTFAVAGQSVAEMQPTQAPVIVSHSSPRPHAPASGRHAA